MKEMPEGNVLGKPESQESEIDLLEDAADAAGLGAELPRKGTEAYSRLYRTCKEYSDQVHKEMTDRLQEPLSSSQSRRRQLHNQLCIMLLGTDHYDTRQKAPGDIKKVANFAHIVSGREQYVEE